MFNHAVTARYQQLSHTPQHPWYNLLQGGNKFVNVCTILEKKLFAQDKNNVNKVSWTRLLFKRRRGLSAALFSSDA
jgi:hypothetical protein